MSRSNGTVPASSSHTPASASGDTTPTSPPASSSPRCNSHPASKSTFRPLSLFPAARTPSPQASFANRSEFVPLDRSRAPPRHPSAGPADPVPHSLPEQPSFSSTDQAAGPSSLREAACDQPPHSPAPSNGRSTAPSTPSSPPSSSRAIPVPTAAVPIPLPAGARHSAAVSSASPSHHSQSPEFDFAGDVGAGDVGAGDVGAGDVGAAAVRGLAQSCCAGGDRVTGSNNPFLAIMAQRSADGLADGAVRCGKPQEVEIERRKMRRRRVALEGYSPGWGAFGSASHSSFGRSGAGSSRLHNESFMSGGSANRAGATGQVDVVGARTIPVPRAGARSGADGGGALWANSSRRDFGDATTPDSLTEEGSGFVPGGKSMPASFFTDGHRSHLDLFSDSTDSTGTPQPCERLSCRTSLADECWEECEHHRSQLAGIESPLDVHYDPIGGSDSSDEEMENVDPREGISAHDERDDDDPYSGALVCSSRWNANE